MDLVIWAGPVGMTDAIKAIPWKRPTKVAVVSGKSSTGMFSDMARELKGSDGRILPGVLKHYAGVERAEVGKLALCAWSAGWAFLNQILKDERDRRDVNAVVASDAAFGGGLTGYERYAADAINGRGLMVATTTNQSANWAAGIYKTARETWLEIQDNAIAQAKCYCLPGKAAARSPMPAPSGGVWKTGSSLYWYDYVVPGSPANSGNDFTHGEHAKMAPLAWEAYLVLLFAGVPWATLLGMGIAAAGAYAASRVWRRG